MANDETLAQLGRLRADALFGKKKHYNAADRKEISAVTLTLGIVLINVLVGSALFALLKEAIPEWAKWVGAFLSFLGAALGTIQTYLGYQKAAPGHRAIGGRYLSLMKRCDRLRAYHADGLRDMSQLATALEALARECDDINADAHALPTNERDIRLAREAIQSGEEEYTDKELGGVHRGA